MCFGGGGSSQQQMQVQATSGSSGYDPWVTQSGQGLYGQASDWLTQNPWKNYSGPLSASFGDPFNQATTYLSGLLGQVNPYTTQAAQGYSSVAGAINPNASVSDYMSPYLSAVLAPTLDNIRQTAGEQGQANNANATMQGAYGGTGSGVVQALLDKNTQQQVANATGQAYNNAFTNAQGARLQNLQTLMNASQGLGGLGQQAFGQGTTLASLLAGLGSQEQQAGQSGIQNALNLHTTDQMGQMRQLTSLAALLQAIPKNQWNQSLSIGSGNSQSQQQNNSGMGILGSLLGSLFS